MTSTGYGILAIWHDLDPACEDAFSEWHSREHMAERLSVPGFLMGCRYESVDSYPLVFNYYVTESPSILTSQSYLERLNHPSKWTTRIMPALRNVYRAVGHEVARAGIGQGDAIATLRFTTVTQLRPQFQSWMVKNGLNGMLDIGGIHKVYLWQTDLSASALRTVESNARGGNLEVREWTIALEGADIPPIRTACDWLQQQKNFSEVLQEKALVGCYRLMHRTDS